MSKILATTAAIVTAGLIAHTTGTITDKQIREIKSVGLIALKRLGIEVDWNKVTMLNDTIVQKALWMGASDRLDKANECSRKYRDTKGKSSSWKKCEMYANEAMMIYNNYQKVDNEVLQNDLAYYNAQRVKGH